MREPERKQIDGTTYIVTPLGSKKGLRLMTRLLRVGGPGLTKLATADIKGPKVMGIPVAAIVAAADGMLERLADDDLEFVCETLSDCTQYVPAEGGKAMKLQPVWDGHFGTGYASLFQWLKFALEVNFGPLFVALRDAMPTAAESSSAEQDETTK